MKPDSILEEVLFMGESELIDLFPNNTRKDGGQNNQDFNMDEEFFNPGRSKINDYKHTSNTIHKSNGGNISENYSANYTAPARENKKSVIDVSDERIVWAGAIFVFFGVLVFLIGYWLGGRTIKDVNALSKQSQQNIMEKLDQKKLENNIIMGSTSPANEGDKAEAIAPVAAPAQKTALTESTEDKPAIEVNPEAIHPSKVGAIKTLPIHAKTADKRVIHADSKNVKLQTADTVKKSGAVTLKTETKSEKATAAAAGNYTIQISAHTSMEKARSVEDSVRKLGYQSYLVEADVNGITYYRVRAGKFPAREDAQSALGKIKETSLGKDSFILNLK